MELRHLRYLLAVHEHRNFTRASEALHVSQPTLSQQIRDLEQELDCLLFHREYHQLIPTDAGEMACNYAREIFAMVGELSHSMKEIKGLERGRLRIGVIQTFNAFYLPALLSTFIADKPAIDVEVEELSNDEISAAVLSGRLHIGIGFTASDDRLHTAKLYDEGILVACTNSHRLAGRTEIKIEALADEALLALPKRFTTRKWVEELMAKHRTVPRRTIEFNTITAIMNALHVIDAVALLPAVTKRHQPDDRLHFAKLKPALPMRSVSLHRLPSAGSIPLVRAFEQFLLKNI